MPNQITDVVSLANHCMAFAIGLCLLCPKIFPLCSTICPLCFLAFPKFFAYYAHFYASQIQIMLTDCGKN